MASTHARITRQRGGIDAVGRQLLAVPAGADAEQDAAAGEQVEGGDRLGERDRVVLRNEADPGPEPEAVGDGRHGGQGDEGVEQTPEAVVHLRSTWGPRRAMDGQVGVRGEEERVEAVLLHQAPIVGGELTAARSGHRQKQRGA